ncbi:glycosyltransferase family 4 protein [Natronorubrum sp. A-ect3]|uniref:glycosyltransferase family 4 protein n=1 Tax=Natronorubrum sp. A-ect3 TaxID=3242698 RepID=UPI00359E1871
MPIKVLQISTTSNRSFLQNQIKTLEKNGIDCDLVTANKGMENFSNNANPVIKKIVGEPGYNPRYYSYMSINLYRKILSSIYNNDYDLVHVNSGLAAPFGLLQPIRPVVISFWGSDVMGEYLNGYSAGICDYCARACNEVIVMSREMDRQLSTDCSIIPHGVNLDEFRPLPKAKCLERVNWNSNEYNILFPYNKDRTEKRYDLAKQIVNNVKNNINKPINLRVVTGVPHEEIVYYMNASDALLLTSKHEGSPNTVKEAMACNLPVVSTDVGDVAQLLSGVENSFVCNDKSELIKCLHDVVVSEEQSNGREFAAELSLQTMGEEIISVYQDALENRGSSK